MKYLLFVITILFSVRLSAQEAEDLNDELNRNIFYLNEYYLKSDKKWSIKEKLFKKEFNYKKLVKSIDFNAAKINYLDTLEVRRYYDMQRFK